MSATTSTTMNTTENVSANASATTATSTVDQAPPRCGAADAGPAGVPPAGTDRRDGEETGLYGPRGWTVRAGVWHELVRCRDDLRSTIIPAEYGRDPDGLITDAGEPEDDYTPFHDLGPRTARRLLSILPPAQLRDRQNLAPTLGALLRACARAGGRVRLSGYAIGPQRPDERVTVEGLWISDPALLELKVSEVHDEYCACRALWDAVRGRFELDAEATPDEIRPLPRHWTRGPLGTWLWWD